MRLDALEGHLKRATVKGLASLYVVHDDEHLLALGTVDALRQAACVQGFIGCEVMSVERGSSWSHVTEAQQLVSLFGDRKIVELRIPSDRPGEDGGGALRTLAAGTPSGLATDTVALITPPRLDFTTVKSAWLAALGGAGISIKVDSVDRTELSGWVGECLAHQQRRVEPGEPGRRALQFIVDCMEGNLLAARQGIQKLSLLHPPGVLMFDDVHDAALNVVRYGVFRLSEAMLAGGVSRLVRMFEGLRGEGEATVLVFWTLMEGIRVLSRVASGAAQGKPVMSMLRELRVWGPRERLAPQAAQRLSQRELEEALSIAAKLDRQIKRLREPSLPAEPWDGLLQLAMRITRPDSLPVPA